jgi:xanthine dehydrogenase accessory factor
VHKELELWQFIAARLHRGEDVMLLVVAESSGSSPGRQGYKMAVAANGQLLGSIGGGVMEVNLVEESRRALRPESSDAGGSDLSVPPAVAGGFREQVHRKDSPQASGMICSGKQTVIFKMLTPENTTDISNALRSLTDNQLACLRISRDAFQIVDVEKPPATAGGSDKAAEFTSSETDFIYTQTLGIQNHLYIIGGGHCALALSELMSKMDFYISLFDDRPDLDTISKNEYTDDIKIVDSYERIGDHIPSGPRAYVVVMTLGYKTDEIVIRGLIDKEFRYFGVLGSKAKMSTMFRSFREDGISDERLARIHTPIGLPINSRSPEEIAVSIAAEIISIKNG